MGNSDSAGCLCSVESNLFQLKSLFKAGRPCKAAAKVALYSVSKIYENFIGLCIEKESERSKIGLMERCTFRNVQELWFSPWELKTPL
jgi:hypothetical protein